MSRIQVESPARSEEAAESAVTRGSAYGIQVEVAGLRSTATDARMRLVVELCGRRTLLSRDRDRFL